MMRRLAGRVIDRDGALQAARFVFANHGRVVDLRTGVVFDVETFLPSQMR